MNRPPVSRGGFFKASAIAWKKAHLSARWTSEAPAPDWWAEIDVLWQIDQEVLPSIRDYADFLGWGKGRAERLIAAAGLDLDRWSRDKNGTKTRQQRDSSETETGQLDKVEPAQSEASRDSSETAARQRRDTSRAPDLLSQTTDYRLQTTEKEGESAPPQPQKESPPEPVGASGGASGRPSIPESNQGQARPVPVASLEVPAEGDLLPLLMQHLNGGHAVQVARKLFDSGVRSVVDAAALDEFNIGQIVGSNCKVGTLKALRAGGWVPPKERSARPVLPAGTSPGVKTRTLFSQIGKEDPDAQQPRRNQRIA